MREETIEVRVTPGEKSTMRAAAESGGMSMSAWARSTLLRTARAEIDAANSPEFIAYVERAKAEALRRFGCK